MPHQERAHALLDGLADLGGTTRSLEELAQTILLPVPDVAGLLTGPGGCSGLEALGLVGLRRTRSGGLEISLTLEGLKASRRSLEPRR